MSKNGKGAANEYVDSKIDNPSLAAELCRCWIWYQITYILVEENAEFDVHKLKETLENNFLKTINEQTAFFFLTKLNQNAKTISRKLVEEKFYFSEGETSFF